MMTLRVAAAACIMLAGVLTSAGRATVHRLDASAQGVGIEGVWYIPSLDACATIGPDMLLHIAGPYGALMSDTEGYAVHATGPGTYTVELPVAMEKRRKSHTATIELRLGNDGTTLEFVQPRNGWRVNLLALLAPRLNRGVRHDSRDQNPTPTAIRAVGGFNTTVSL